MKKIIIPILTLLTALTMQAETKVLIETSMGNIVIRLYDDTPKHRDNFIKLVESGYYNDLLFHRVIKDFMIQGGDPTIGSSLTVDRHIVGEFSENGYDNPLSHTAGAISMIRSGDYDSANSAFSILRTDRTDMDGKYAVFGYVIEGMDVVTKIEKRAVDSKLRPIEPAIIKRVREIEKPL